MQNKLMLLLILTVSLTTLSSCEKEEDQVPTSPQRLLVQAVGVATGSPVQMSLPGTDLEVSGNAFTMNFFDPANGEKLGTLTDINVAAEAFPDGSMKGENFTIFEFSADNSSLVLHNFIDMTPLDETTLQGVIPVDKSTTNLIAGTGKYSGVSGGSTLHAILDMSAFAEGTVGFNCTYDMQILK